MTYVGRKPGDTSAPAKWKVPPKITDTVRKILGPDMNPDPCAA
jgi:hypothetical protein